MELYYTPGACSLVPHIIINELKIPAKFISVNLKEKKTENGENYLTINPKGAVPTLKTNEGEFLTENAVILQYLADTNHASELLPTVGDFKRYRVLEWTNYATTELHKTLGLMFNPMITDEMKRDILIPLAKKKLDFVNEHLRDKKFLLGDSFTIADAYVFVMLTWLHHFKMYTRDWSNLSRYFNEIKTRPAVEKTLQEEGLEKVMSE